MWEIVNNLKPEAWTGMGILLTAFLSGLAAAVAVVMRGLKASPQQAGTLPPPVDRTEYAIAELRELVRHIKNVSEQLEEVDRRTEALHLDTTVILDRLDRLL